MNIFALSSGRGPCGIAIIRLSGSDTIKISQLITQTDELKLKTLNLCKEFYYCLKAQTALRGKI